VEESLRSDTSLGIKHRFPRQLTNISDSTVFADWLGCVSGAS